jgi:hypothetical protein
MPKGVRLIEPPRHQGTKAPRKAKDSDWLKKFRNFFAVLGLLGALVVKILGVFDFN